MSGPPLAAPTTPRNSARLLLTQPRSQIGTTKGTAKRCRSRRGPRRPLSTRPRCRQREGDARPPPASSRPWRRRPRRPGPGPRGGPGAPGPRPRPRLLDVHRKGQMHRSGAPAAGGLEGLAHLPGDAFGNVEDARVLADRGGQGHLLEVLEMPHPRRRQRPGAGQQQHRGAVEVGVDDAGQGVGVGDAAADRTDPGLAAHAAPALGHVGGGLLVAGVDQADAGTAAGGVHLVEAVAAQGRDPLDAQARQRLRQQVGAVHGDSGRILAGRELPVLQQVAMGQHLTAAAVEGQAHR